MAKSKKKKVTKKIVVRKHGDPNLILKIMETVAVAREQARVLGRDDFERLCEQEDISRDRKWLVDLPFGPGSNYNNVARTLMNRFVIVERENWPGMVTPNGVPPTAIPTPPENVMAPVEPGEQTQIPDDVKSLEVGKEDAAEYLNSASAQPPDDSPVEGEVVSVPAELAENIDNEVGAGERG